jgi:tRNA (cytidine/uridine-2'-O-)-methyltransferase
VKHLQICLFEPEIAQNTGAIARLCACYEVSLNIIEPASFVIDNNKLVRRAGMDYLDHIRIIKHDSFNSFQSSYSGRIVLFDTKANQSYYDFQFSNFDCLLFGKESSGVPDYIYNLCEERVIIAMPNAEARSLNVAMCAAIGLSEAKRQLGSPK